MPRWRRWYPAARIIAGRLPEATDLPAVSITSVSTLRGPDVAQGASRQRLARVQVTVVANSYPQQKDILRLVVDALPRCAAAWPAWT
jgi:hypothetical protein